MNPCGLPQNLCLSTFWWILIVVGLAWTRWFVGSYASEVFAGTMVFPMCLNGYLSEVFTWSVRFANLCFVSATFRKEGSYWLSGSFLRMDGVRWSCHSGDPPRYPPKVYPEVYPLLFFLSPIMEIHLPPKRHWRSPPKMECSLPLNAGEYPLQDDFIP